MIGLPTSNERLEATAWYKAERRTRGVRLALRIYEEWYAETRTEFIETWLAPPSNG